ncbi:hypothetical protein BU24DRAFT_411329 [Aaosphaeria arxii CBS 175.79]|uniref:Uncharacterized protein n=1 Tax=Aaosphaeria arxii CBS 175.79 TaxID=1450172 RepID=A0A6A5XMP5_9PLEO|nr:uncharacterized protein BU24DRAFT_411329 [Aaosphaeria arxii CBS 175.79]KAF2013604.1 hypothetical protein BU24DRAFT_411329 [Aaosphaeria arxii CBS 175.79]
MSRRQVRAPLHCQEPLFVRASAPGRMIGQDLVKGGNQQGVATRDPEPAPRVRCEAPRALCICIYQLGGRMISQDLARGANQQGVATHGRDPFEPSSRDNYDLYSDPEPATRVRGEAPRAMCICIYQLGANIEECPLKPGVPSCHFFHPVTATGTFA